MVSKANHTATYNEQTLIGFINYYLVLAAGTVILAHNLN